MEVCVGHNIFKSLQVKSLGQEADFPSLEERPVAAGHKKDIQERVDTHKCH